MSSGIRILSQQGGRGISPNAKPIPKGTYERFTEIYENAKKEAAQLAGLTPDPADPARWVAELPQGNAFGGVFNGVRDGQWVPTATVSIRVGGQQIYLYEEVASDNTQGFKDAFQRAIQILQGLDVTAIETQMRVIQNQEEAIESMKQSLKESHQLLRKMRTELTRKVMKLVRGSGLPTNLPRLFA